MNTSFQYEQAFHRNRGILNAEDQNKLKNAHVAIIGLGGTGGAQAEALARLGIGRFTLADPDHFELSNFNRQFGASIDSLGKRKAKATADIIRSINPEAVIRIFDEGIQTSNIDECLESVDVILDSLDFMAFEARLLLYRKSREKGLWVINTAPAGFGINMLIFNPKAMGFEDYFDIKNSHLSRDEVLIALVLGLNPSLLSKKLSYVNPKEIHLLPCVSPAFFLVAGFAATEAVKIILGKKNVLAVPWVFEFDAMLYLYKKKYYPWGMRSPWQRFKKKMAKNLLLKNKTGTAVPSVSHTEMPIQNIVKMAQKAPTGDNAQPWKFVWDGKMLEIVQDDARAAHAMNRANHASCLSLGCVLESISIAASKEGFKAIWDIKIESLNISPRAAVRFEKTNMPPHELCRILSDRETDRRLFKGGDANEPFLETVRNAAHDIRNCRIYLQPPHSEKLTNYISRCESFAFNHDEVRKDVYKWLRLSDREAEVKRDGLPWRNLGLTYIQTQILKLCENDGAQRFFNRLGLSNEIRKNARKAIFSSAVLGCITVNSKEADELVEAGRLFLRAWCYLNLNGYGFQPMTSAVFPIYDQRTGALDERKILPEYIRLFESGFGVLQEAFGFQDGEIPVMLFRAGISTPLPEKAKTRRLDLKEALILKS